MEQNKSKNTDTHRHRHRHAVNLTTSFLVEPILGNPLFDTGPHQIWIDRYPWRERSWGSFIARKENEKKPHDISTTTRDISRFDEDQYKRIGTQRVVSNLS